MPTTSRPRYPAGDLEGGLDWLERAIDLGMFNQPFLRRYDRLIDPLRDERRFGALMAAVDSRLEGLRVGAGEAGTRGASAV